MTEATAAQFALTIIACSYTVWLAICLRQTRKELNGLKSRMAKPGEVSRLIEQYERDLAKGEHPPRQPKTFPPGRVLREGQEPPKPKTYSMPVPVPECWKPHKAHDIVMELESQAMNDQWKSIVDADVPTTSFGGGDFGGSGAGDSYGSSDGGGSSSND